jgi:hypothetical protein
MRTNLALIAPVLMLASACNVVTTGDRGELTFTPDDCGQYYCSLDLPLAAGSSMIVDLGDVHGHDVSFLDLVAGDSHVAIVVPVPLFAGDWRWRVYGLAGGTTRLYAVDGAGNDIDQTLLEVETPSRLGLTLEHGPAASHADDPFGLEVWTVTAASRVAFQVRPLDWAGGTMMGKLELTADLDASLFAALDPAADVTAGELAMRPMAPGDYGVSFYGPNQLLLDVIFEVR